MHLNNYSKELVRISFVNGCANNMCCRLSKQYYRHFISGLDHTNGGCMGVVWGLYGGCMGVV